MCILGKGTTRGLNNTTLTAKAEYSITFSRLERKFCLSVHYNGSSIYFIFNATKINVTMLQYNLLIAVSINCYLMKYGAKQKYLLPFHDIAQITN